MTGKGVLPLYISIECTGPSSPSRPWVSLSRSLPHHSALTQHISPADWSLQIGLRSHCMTPWDHRFLETRPKPAADPSPVKSGGFCASYSSRSDSGDWITDICPRKFAPKRAHCVPKSCCPMTLLCTKGRTSLSIKFFTGIVICILARARASIFSYNNINSLLLKNGLAPC